MLGLVLAGSMLLACGTADQGAEPDAKEDTLPSPQLPDVTTYDVDGDEPAAEVKQAAVLFLEAVFNYEQGAGTAEAARERLEEEGLEAQAIADDDIFHGGQDAAGAAQLVYPQLGGLGEEEASIMAVTEIATLKDDSLVSESRVIDLRLEASGQDWRVSEIASMGGTPPDLPEAEEGQAQDTQESDLDDVVVEVLESPSIELPSTARWDIMQGRIDERLLSMMLDLAESNSISVAVLSTGHPVNVFDSSSESNHTRGRAVDIWAIDGMTVAELRAAGTDGPAGTLMQEALARGSTEVGGPWALSTKDGATFTDLVHNDHLHVGFKQ